MSPKAVISRIESQYDLSRDTKSLFRSIDVKNSKSSLRLSESVPRFRNRSTMNDAALSATMESMMKKSISNKKLRLHASDVSAVNSRIEQIKKKTEMKARAQLVLFKKEMVRNDIK